MILTKDQALKVSGRTFATLKVDELDGELRLGSLTAGPSLAFAELKKREASGESVTRELMLVLIRAAVVDEQGSPLFDAASAELFLDRISLSTMTAIMNAVPQPAASPTAVPLGNSAASPAPA